MCQLRGSGLPKGEEGEELWPWQPQLINLRATM